MSGAEIARSVLKEADINVETGPENRVTLSAQFHKFLHNKFYVTGIDVVFLAIREYSYAAYPGDKEKLYQNVCCGLEIIAGCLETADKYVSTFY